MRWSVSARMPAMSSMLSASSRKSSSSTMVSANSSTSAGGLARAATGMRPIRQGRSSSWRPGPGPHEVGDRGPLHLHHDLLAGDGGWPRAPGRWRRRPAAARSNCENTSSRGRPRSASTIWRTASNGSAGTWSRRSWNSLDQLVGEDALAGGQDLPELDVGRARAARRPGAAGGTARRGTARGGPATALASLDQVPAADGRPEDATRPGPPADPAGIRRRRSSWGT